VQGYVLAPLYYKTGTMGRIGSTKLVLPNWHKYRSYNRVVRVRGQKMPKKENAICESSLALKMFHFYAVTFYLACLVSEEHCVFLNVDREVLFIEASLKCYPETLFLSCKV
jgi:hypothetical protein